MAKEFLNESSDGPSPRRTVFVADYLKNEANKRGIVDYARTRGWHVLDLTCYPLKLPGSLRVDGVLFNLPEENAPLVKRLRRLGVPAVEIEDHYARLRCPHVIWDRRAIGRAAAEHFAERGFCRMAYLRSEAWRSRPNHQIRESFLEHARALGATAHAFELHRLGRLVPWNHIDVFADRLRKELDRLPLPVGILAFHDIMATRVCHFCAAAVVDRQQCRREGCDCRMLLLIAAVCQRSIFVQEYVAPALESANEPVPDNPAGPGARAVGARCRRPGVGEACRAGRPVGLRRIAS